MFTYTSAKQKNQTPSTTHPRDELDTVCRSGAYPGWQIGYFQYDVPAKRFFAEMESFFNAGWYVDVIATKGTDNTPGAVRTVKYVEKEGSSEPVIFDERLILYTRSENKLEIYWTGGPVTFPYKPHAANFESYVEGFTVTSICAGTATHLSFSVNYTTTTAVPSYHFTATDQREAVAALAKRLGAQSFMGTYSLDHVTKS